MRGNEIVAFIPARSGSQRIKGKNIRNLNGHPLLAYAIAAAREAGIFSRIIVSTDSTEYAQLSRKYGAEVPFMRPVQFATGSSPDIEWILHALENIDSVPSAFAIIRPTSPLRRGATIRKAWQALQTCREADSLRAVERVRQHPGKMWRISDDGRTMTPLLDQSDLKVAWHAGQLQALPPIYVQNSALEIAWVDAVLKSGTREGYVQMPFFTEEIEGIALDYEDEWERVVRLVNKNPSLLPSVEEAIYD